jgi:prepilin-type N-terminal cleavage/methylation domain-containing protein/prepilin-type processing-associated H-X9-DG protein
MKHSSKRAFTLTELLVVVPVGALLATMLFAASNDAKQQLQAAACLNNMRQWGLGFMLYANDHGDYFPYDGDYDNPPCATGNTNAWYNVVPPYIGQKSLCALYTAGTFPTPLTKSVWSCPSETNVTLQPTQNNAYFMYAISVCWHREGDTTQGIRRNRATSPGNTILFCEEEEDNFPETSGAYDTVTRHFGGSNFVFADGHAGWITFTNFCRQNNPPAPPCPSPLGNIAWNNSQGGNANGDWNSIVRYHWWPFVGASTAPQ